MTDPTDTAPPTNPPDPPALAARPVLTDKQREQLRVWHESLGHKCIASIETVPCCIEYLLDSSDD